MLLTGLKRMDGLCCSKVLPFELKDYNSKCLILSSFNGASSDSLKQHGGYPKFSFSNNNKNPQQLGNDTNAFKLTKQRGEGRWACEQVAEEEKMVLLLLTLICSLPSLGIQLIISFFLIFI